MSYITCHPRTQTFRVTDAATGLVRHFSSKRAALAWAAALDIANACAEV